MAHEPEEDTPIAYSAMLQTDVDVHGTAATLSAVADRSMTSHRWNHPTTGRALKVLSRRSAIVGLVTSMLVVALLAAATGTRPTPARAQEPATFDLDAGSAPIEIVVPRVIPAIYGSLSPNANDATLVLRVTTLVTNAWFDAIAPYHPTAVGVYSRIDRRPTVERETNRQRNIALVYASYRVLNSVLPDHAADWRDMVVSAGLDPDDSGIDTTTPVGIGNVAGDAVVAAREHDGMNQLGDEGGVVYNRRPYADYTGYTPVNTADELVDPTRWQPLVLSDRVGSYRVQRFVTPQMRLTAPYSYDDPGRFRVPPPWRSQREGARGRRAYRAQADEVLAASAELTDHQKMAAELFDNKIEGLGSSALFAAQSQGLDLDEFVHFDFLTNLAAFDAAIAVWDAKYEYDAVRPVTAIRFLYGDDPVTAWGGPGEGTVDDLPADQWRSYLDTADHPEYPSASTALCAAHAQAARRYLGSDQLGWSVPRPEGSSRIEPGVTPAGDLTLAWDSWTDFEHECGISRFWGGVHFTAAITHGERVGHRIGNHAHRFVERHIDGTAPLR